MIDSFLAMSLADQVIAGAIMTILLFLAIAIVTVLPYCFFNRKTDQLPHILDGKPVDIPVLDGEEFQHNKEKARKILESQKR